MYYYMNYKEKYIKYKKKYLNLKKIENSNYCKKIQKGGGIENETLDEIIIDYKKKYNELKKIQLGGNNFVFNIFNYLDIKIKKITNNNLNGGRMKLSAKNKYAKKPNKMKSYYEIELSLHKKKYPQYIEIQSIIISSSFNDQYIRNIDYSKKKWRSMAQKNKYNFTLEDIGQKKINFYVFLSAGNTWINKKYINNLPGDILLEKDFSIDYLLSKNKVNKKKKKDRPSPSESATKFKVGKKKKGNDGNMWIIVENKNGVKRWSKIK